MPMARHVRITRSAISPRFAIRTLSITRTQQRYNNQVSARCARTARTLLPELVDRDARDPAIECGRAEPGVELANRTRSPPLGEPEQCGRAAVPGLVGLVAAAVVVVPPVRRIEGGTYEV